MNLTDLFDLTFQGPRAHSIALEFEGQEFTFRELDERSNRVARYLLENGFTLGDRLCVYLANRVEMIDLYLACIKLGVIFVPINILYRGREIGHILSDADPAAVVSDARFASPVEIWHPATLAAEAAAADWCSKRSSNRIRHPLISQQ